MAVLLLQLRENKVLSFSVVIPVFNRVDSLQKTLDSVMAQTVQSFEVIIVDDGSPLDVSEKIKKLVEQFSDQRIRLIRHDINKNGAAARNTGIDAAKGLFLCFLDSDDTWLPTKLALVGECIQASENKNNFLIHHQYCNQKNGVMSAPLPKGAMSQGESVAHYSFVTNNVGGIQSSTICVPTELAKRVKFNESFSGHQDWDFALRIGELTQDFRFIDKPLTIRSKDSKDSVADELDWKYSLWFYCQMFSYFGYVPTYNYFRRVVLKKAKFSRSVAPIFINKLFFKSLLAKPVYTLLNSVSFLTKNLKFNIRVRSTLKVCRVNNAKTVMVWGANEYAKSLILHFDEHIKVTRVIDANASLKNKCLLNISISPIWSIDINEIENVDLIILATDNHKESMINELSNINPELINKVVKF